MIVFDLSCAVGAHRFEAWFASSDSYVDQRERRLIACPICGDTEVNKAVMAPRICAKSNQLTAPCAAPVSTKEPAPVPVMTTDEGQPSPDFIRRVVAEIAAQQAAILPQSRWVGRDFSDAARAMHEGRAADHLIHGEASPEEAEALRDDGIAAMPLLVPIVPPDLAN
jgi:hypothetical protein